MLVVDLRRLAREGRLSLEGAVGPADALWQEEDPRPLDDLAVSMDVQHAAGDVLVQGTLEGAVELPCRRCLESARVDIVEPLTLLFREGVGEEEDGFHPLPERAHELDLGPAVREHWLLAAPQFAVCREECRGLCPHCGQNLNEGDCACQPEERDERWAALLRLKKE